MINPLKYQIKIPKSIKVIKSKNKLYIKGAKTTTVFNLKTKILFFYNNKTELFLKVTRIPLTNDISSRKNKLKIFQGTTYALIKQQLKSVLLDSVKTLTLSGIGYKVFLIRKKNFQLLCFKLGYSHNIYCKIPNTITLKCPSVTTISITGSNIEKVTQFAALLKSFKVPDSYKGKGILYKNELLKLKESKKT
jgi:large subunit ribosomal protein L6